MPPDPHALDRFLQAQGRALRARDRAPAARQDSEARRAALRAKLAAAAGPMPEAPPPLWPAGHTLLGLQVYDNRRAVDYLCSRPEVDPDRLGITGASGGGNQTMYAGALDERLKAVVPVCSVGTYQAYLHAACCVCEVLPGALRFTEEGDVLGLVTPRALLVINASKDAIQFSPAEAEKSVDRAKRVFNLSGVRGNLKHLVFESAHDYNKPMSEA